MGRRGLVLLSALFVSVPVLVVACGDDSTDGAAGTLPPINTTTTTTIPVTTTTEYVPISYEIASGDSLRAIADKYAVDYQELITLNSILDPDHIEVGDVLQIPPPTTVTTTTTTTTTTTLPPTTTTEG
ncbi:MAG: LysM domain-containing protein [Acidimicrobiales bacterium]